MNQKKSKKDKSERQELIERLLGTNDCGEKGIGDMVIGSTFYVGRRYRFSNDL